MTPLSLYNVLAARQPATTVEGHMKLARLAEELGLLPHAIAELRMVSTMDADQKAIGEQEVLRIRGRIASALLDEAQASLEAGDWERAKLNAQVLAESYADTKSAEKVPGVMREVMSVMQAQAKVRYANEKELEKATKKANEYLARVEKLGIVPRAGIGIKSKERRRREPDRHSSQRPGPPADEPRLLVELGDRGQDAHGR